MNWQDVSTNQKYVGQPPNQYALEGNIVINVFCRRAGWSWTAKYKTPDGEWLQWSAGNSEYWVSREHAKQPAILGYYKLLYVIEAVKKHPIPASVE